MVVWGCQLSYKSIKHVESVILIAILKGKKEKEKEKEESVRF